MTRSHSLNEAFYGRRTPIHHPEGDKPSNIEWQSHSFSHPTLWLCLRFDQQRRGETFIPRQ